MGSLYFDHAASAPLRPEARAALDEWFGRTGNPSATHAAGHLVRTAVEGAREQVAECLGAQPADIVFTSGGTEADNLGIKGLAEAAAAGRRHLVTTAVEHPAVRESVRWLASRGWEVTEVPPTRDGVVPAGDVLDAIRDDTALVTVMAANNEIGARNDIGAIGRVLHERDVAFHTDAVQAVATVPVDVEAWPVDALALSAHKFGGPQGVGVACLRSGVAVAPVQHGGGQDRGVRSGTFPAALIAAAGAALVATVAERDELHGRLEGFRKLLVDRIAAVDGIRVNGPDAEEQRLASHVHLSIDGVHPDDLGLALDRAGLHASSASACVSGAGKASHVVEACRIHGDAALRLSMGTTTTIEEVEEAAAILTDVVLRLRAGEPVVEAPHSPTTVGA
ncbi:MAG: cysteine desulfurase family protein [Nitriliruptorales bacterium]|nr:cysteine desulfurase family protein [Nitriliruptorales bacterium]